MATSSTLPKIAFIYDDHLSHDRKIAFTRNMVILKARLEMDIIPSLLTEAKVIEQLTRRDYSLILLPWHKYLTWKKLENHFGALRLHGPTVAGYFADAILPFELAKMPNFNRMILLDFYRLDQNEIEMMIRALADENKKTGLAGFVNKNTQVFHAHWLKKDHRSTHCIDQAMNIPLMNSFQWTERNSAIRIYLTALWSLCFREYNTVQTLDSRAELEITEVNKCLAIKLIFQSQDLNLKNLMNNFWPNHSQDHDQTIRELVRHSDFMRIHHFPETHTIEMTAFFTSGAPSLVFPGEARGFWIEPLKQKFLIPSDITIAKRIPIHLAKREIVSEQIEAALESLRLIYHQISFIAQEESLLLKHQISQLSILVQEIEKKVAEKKKIA